MNKLYIIFALGATIKAQDCFSSEFADYCTGVDCEAYYKESGFDGITPSADSLTDAIRDDCYYYSSDDYGYYICYYTALYCDDVDCVKSLALCGESNDPYQCQIDYCNTSYPDDDDSYNSCVDLVITSADAAFNSTSGRRKLKSPQMTSGSLKMKNRK